MLATAEHYEESDLISERVVHALVPPELLRRAGWESVLSDELFEEIVGGLGRKKKRAVRLFLEFMEDYHANVFVYVGQPSDVELALKYWGQFRFGDERPRMR